jgi:hypothetical protein
LSDKVHLLHIALVRDDDLAGSVDSAVHCDDKLIGETSLAFLEEVVEGSFELFEHPGVLNEIGLHFWGNLLIELELFNDKVKIVQESLLNILSDIVVECWLNMERLVGLLNLLDPHVEGVKLLFNEVIEVIRSVENTVNGSHEEGEESKTHKLKGN